MTYLSRNQNLHPNKKRDGREWAEVGSTLGGTKESTIHLWDVGCEYEMNTLTLGGDMDGMTHARIYCAGPIKSRSKDELDESFSLQRRGQLATTDHGERKRKSGASDDKQRSILGSPNLEGDLALWTCEVILVTVLIHHHPSQLTVNPNPYAGRREGTGSVGRGKKRASNSFSASQRLSEAGKNGISVFEEGLLQMRQLGFATTAVNPVMSQPLAHRLAVLLLNSAIPAVESAIFKLNNCGRAGHFARNCPNSGANGFASRAPPPGRSLNTSTLPPVKCYRCGGPNHMARDCLAAPGTTVADTTANAGGGNPNKNKTCYKCQQEGHIARDCPENAE
ncbi:hypothetical protein C8Q75DRAFT_729847 [Abortiporus biennis]|nr:hypothetical protein C8Q75DRAFT_729847 [Abortiporus biennis]